MLIYQAFKNTLRHNLPHFIKILAQNPWANRTPADLNVFDFANIAWIEQKPEGKIRQFVGAHQGRRLLLVLEPVGNELQVKSLSYMQ